MMFNHVAVVIVAHLVNFSQVQVVGYQSTPIKHVVLTPQNANSQGASIDYTISNASEVTPSPTQWSIVSTSEDTWHLLMQYLNVDHVLHQNNENKGIKTRKNWLK